MKRFQLFAALVMTQLVMGCCCGRSFVVDSCDPCYNPCQPHCCGVIGALKSLWPFGCCHGGCSSGYAPMYSEFPSSCGCGGYDGMSMGAPVSGSSCGCSQGASQMMAPTMAPAMNPEPTPTSPTVAPVPPVSPSDATSMAPMTSNPNVQHVSYEEFQKLPGTVTSGQGALMNAAPNNSVAIPAPVAPTASAPSVQRSIGTTQRFVPRSVATSAPLTAQAKPQMWVPAH